MPQTDQQIMTQLVVEAIAQGFQDVEAQIKKLTANMKASQKEAAATVKEAEPEKVVSQWEKLNNTLGGLKTNFMELRSGILLAKMVLQGFADTLEAAYNAGKQGAVFEQMTLSWERFLEVVDAAPDTLDRVKIASRGTVDDLTMMSSLTLLAAGSSKEFSRTLMEAAPRLMEIAKAAAILNPQLGDVQYMFDSLARGIKRTSPLILDNLGIIIRQKEAFENYARSIGVSVDALDAEQRKIAILNEVMQTGQLMIDQVGGSTESLVDPFNQLEASWTNFVNVFKSGMVETSSGIVLWANTVVEGLTTVKMAQDMLAKMQKEGVVNVEYPDLGVYTGKPAMNAQEAAEVMKVLVAVQEKAAREAEYLKSNIWDSADAVAYFNAQMEKQPLNFDLAKTNADEYIASLDDVSIVSQEQLQIISEKIMRGSESWREYRTSMLDILSAYTKTNNLTGEAADIYDRLLHTQSLLARLKDAGTSPALIAKRTSLTQELVQIYLELDEALGLAGTTAGGLDPAFSSGAASMGAMGMTAGQLTKYLADLAAAQKEVTEAEREGERVSTALAAGLKGTVGDSIDKASAKTAEFALEQANLRREAEVYLDILSGKTKVSMQGLMGDLNELNKDMQLLKRQGYDENSDAMQRLRSEYAETQRLLKLYSSTSIPEARTELEDLREKLSENEAAQRSLNEAIRETTKAMMYQIAAEGLEAGSALELARAFGMISEADYAIGYALEDLRQKYDQNRDNMIDAAEGAAAYANEVYLMQRAVDELQTAGIVLNLERLLQVFDNLSQQKPVFEGITIQPDTTGLNEEQVASYFQSLLDAAAQGAEIDLSTMPVRPPDMTKGEWEEILSAFITSLTEYAAQHPLAIPIEVDTAKSPNLEKLWEGVEIPADIEKGGQLIDGVGLATFKLGDATEILGQKSEGAKTPVQDLKTNVDALGTAADTAGTAVQNLQGFIDNLKDKTVTITVNYITTGTPVLAAHGLDMVVPPGFPNDSFPIFVSSGERVRVDPSGTSPGLSRKRGFSLSPVTPQMAGQTGLNWLDQSFNDAGVYAPSMDDNSMTVYENNFFDEGASAMGLAFQYRDRRRSINRGM